MGVMACSKKGCDNIMCDHYVPSVGYICYECISDFKKNHYGFKNELELIDILGVYVDMNKKVSLLDDDKFIDMNKFFSDFYIK